MKPEPNGKRHPLIKTLYDQWKQRKIDRLLDEKNFETLTVFLPFEKYQKRREERVELQTILNRYDNTFDQYEQYNQQIETLLTNAGCDVTNVKILSSVFSKERIQLKKDEQTLEYYCYNGVMDSTRGLLKVNPRTVTTVQNIITEAQSQIPEFINGCVLSSTTNRFQITLTVHQVNIGTFLDEMMHQKNFELVHYPHQAQLSIGKIGPRCQSYFESDQSESKTGSGFDQIPHDICVFTDQLPAYLKEPQSTKQIRRK